MNRSDWSRGTCGSFGWLWLTDFHYGRHEQGWLWPFWQEEFFQDIERVYAQSGPWDVLLFTGDLVCSGQPDEFNGLTPILRRLWDFLSTKQATIPYLLSVPGNHDLKRPDKRKAAAGLLRHYWDDRESREDFWSRATSDQRKLITQAFRAYTDWGNSCGFPRPDGYSPGMLPGDFSATLTNGDAKLGIVGLNTTFLQLEEGNYQGKLDLDPRQLHAACGGNAATWIRQRHVCFLLTHQPTDWLNPSAQQLFFSVIYPTQSFAAHFHGHMHERADLILGQGGAAPRRHFQGCSLFGLEHYGDRLDIARLRFGYAAGRLEVNHDRALLYVWPRVGMPQQSRDIRIVQDVTATLIPGKEYIPPTEILLNVPCGSAPSASTAILTHTTDALLAPPPPPDPFTVYRGRQQAIEQRLKDLESVAPALPPGEFLRRVAPIAAEFFDNGSRRLAWHSFDSAFDREQQSLTTDERLSLGLQLARYLLEDGLPDMTAPVLATLQSEADRLPGSDPKKALFWQLQSRCWIGLSDYTSAVQALTRAIDITPDAGVCRQLQAELAELHFLQGNVDEALKSTLTGDTEA
jgi:Calcineurin-like phosphoesterase